MNNQVKYFYIRTPDQNTEKFGHRGKPIACVAYTVSRCRDYLENNDDVNRVQYALATVNGEFDQFDKAYGRALSQQRLLYGSSDEHEHIFTDSVKASDITADIMFALYSDGLTPTRVKKAAKRWLWPFDTHVKSFNESVETTGCNNDCDTIVVSRDVEGYMTLWQSVKHWLFSFFK